MAENQENMVNKDVCEEKHNEIKEKFVKIKANIHTSKESLSNRLDEVDVALLGDRRKPGGLLRDLLEMNNELKRHKVSVEKEIKSMNFRVKTCILLLAFLLGGRLFGLQLDNIKVFFLPKMKTEVSTKESKNISSEDKQSIDKMLEQKNKTTISPAEGKK